MNIRVGSAPDSWGVWFPSDPRQIPWSRFLDEVAEAGYRWTELGPHGYLPTDLATLRGELGRRGLSACAGFIMKALEDPGVWTGLQAEVRALGANLAALGAPSMVLIDDTYTNVFTGEPLKPAQLAPADWGRLVDTCNRAGALAKKEFGLSLVFHPHADTHVEYEAQIETLLRDTDPACVSLCLDTGHHAYRGGDPVAFMRRHHARISYLHLKSVDAALMERVNRERIPFGRAVGMDMFCEPSRGIVDFKAFRAVLEEVGYDGFAVVEQDMYPAAFDKPLPIARRTRAFLREVGIG
jgi:inosose dehydratase